MSDLRIAVVQPVIEDGAVACNLAHYAELLTRLETPTDLILLPEMFPTGYQVCEHVCEAEPGVALAWMRDMAQEYNALLCGTVAIRSGERYYNRFYAVAPDTSFDYYDKRHLFPLAGEEQLFTAGARRVIVAFRGWRIALQICFDLRFPESARNYSDYDLLLYAAAWPTVRDDVWQHLLVARAIENQTYLAASNRVGKDGDGFDYVGHSQILDYKGKSLAVLEGTEGILTATLQTAPQQEYRKRFPVLPQKED